jgi:hypothetical protein
MSKYSRWLKQLKFLTTKLTHFENRSRWETIKNQKHQRSYRQMLWRNRKQRVLLMSWKNLLSLLRTCRQDMMDKCNNYKKCLKNIVTLMNLLSASLKSSINENWLISSQLFSSFKGKIRRLTTSKKNFKSYKRRVLLNLQHLRQPHHQFNQPKMLR